MLASFTRAHVLRKGAALSVNQTKTGSDLMGRSSGVIKLYTGMYPHSPASMVRAPRCQGARVQV